MEDAPAVGVLDRLRQVAHELNAVQQLKSRRLGGQNMIEPAFARVARKYERRAELMLDELLRTRDARVAERLQELVLAPRGARHVLALIFCGEIADSVDADAVLDAREARMHADMVLVARPVL